MAPQHLVALFLKSRRIDKCEAGHGAQEAEDNDHKLAAMMAGLHSDSLSVVLQAQMGEKVALSYEAPTEHERTCCMSQTNFRL